MDNTAKRTDGLATAGPFGSLHGAAHPGDLFLAQDFGDMQQHGGVPPVDQKRTFAVSMAERGVDGV